MKSRQGQRLKAEGQSQKAEGRRQKTEGRRPKARGKRIAEPAGAREIEAIRRQIENVSSLSTPRWNADPDEVRRSVLKLVLTLVELIRQLLERQAIRRMEAGTLSDDETESVGLALMRLEETVRELGSQFGLAPEDLKLDLGPIGKLV